MPSVTHRTFALASPYWLRAPDRAVAWSLGLILVALVFTLTGLSYWVTVLQKTFFDALELRDTESFRKAITLFVAGVVAIVVTSVVKGYLEQALLIRWRTDLTRKMLGRWLTGTTFYRMERDHTCDNPDQRIAQDIAEYVDLMIRLSLGFIANTGTLASMGWLLWKSAGPISFEIAGTPVTIPGYLLWLAVVWGILQTIVTHLAGRQLAAATVVQQSVEANFRFALTRVRDASEQIALYRGGQNEEGRLDRMFDSIRRNWAQIMRHNVFLNTAGSAFGVVAFAVPIIVMAPQVLAGEITLGTLMQDAAAFTATAGAIAWLAWSYRDLFQLSARVQRLSAMIAAMDAPAPAGIELTHAGNPAGMDASKLHLGLPGGRLLTVIDSLDIALGDRCLVRGPSGCGKSTLLRAIAGLWPFHSGSIRIPADARALFLPQKPYLPEARLIEALTYPQPAEAYDRAACVKVLVDCQLSHLLPRLDETARWNHQLSPGEQQRMAFAQILLHKPDFLFMDEATSALDTETETQLMNLLLETLPDCTVVSVASRASLERFHTRLLTLSHAETASPSPPLAA